MRACGWRRRRSSSFLRVGGKRIENYEMGGGRKVEKIIFKVSSFHGR